MPQDTYSLPGDQTPKSKPVTSANAPSIPTYHTNIPHKSFNKLIPVVIILAILALAGLGTSVFFGIQNANQSSEISDLTAKVDNLTKENATLIANTKDPSQTTVNKPQTPDEQTNTSEKETIYLEPEGWNVKFAYPEGVSEVVASLNNTNYDGALYIDSITYNGKVYNVDLFGGASAYHHYPFFLGTLMRWDSEATHEYWENSPTRGDGILIFEQGPIGYYYGAYGGNGYEAGDKSDYETAVDLASQLLHNITAK